MLVYLRHWPLYREAANPAGLAESALCDESEWRKTRQNRDRCRGNLRRESFSTCPRGLDREIVPIPSSGHAAAAGRGGWLLKIGCSAEQAYSHRRQCADNWR